MLKVLLSAFIWDICISTCIGMHDSLFPEISRPVNLNFLLAAQTPLIFKCFYSMKLFSVVSNASLMTSRHSSEKARVL